MTLFPELKDDFTAENGVTYTWEDNRWRTKSFLTADGSVVEVGPIPPNDPSEGGLWYDSTRLELFVYYVDGDSNGGWVPCSPLGARVEAGEILQQQINTRLATVETDFVSKTKNSTITDAYLRLEKVTKADTALVLDFKREEDGNANKSCRFVDFKEDNHRMMDLQSTAAGYTQIQLENNFKQFKIVGKVDGNPGQLFKVYTNGKVGLFNLRYPTADHDAASLKYVQDEIAKVDAGGGGAFQTKYDGNRMCKSGVSSNALDDGEVMFMTNQRVSTTSPNYIQAIGFSLNDFNWAACIKSGVIKVKNGANDAGFYQVYDLELTARQAIVSVEPIFTYGTQSLQPDSGTPCYFQGVFFE